MTVTTNFTRLGRGCTTGTAMLLASILLVGLTGCGRGGENAQPQKKVPLIEVETVTTGEITRSLDLTAEVVSVDVVQISSMVEGPIGFFPWREGDHVEADQKLVEIDREMYRTEVTAAEAALSVAQAKLNDMRAGTRPEEIEKARQSVREIEQSAEFERADLERVSELVETGALPGEDADIARVKQTAAQAKLNAARKQLEMLESGFTRTEVAVQDALVEEAAARLDLAKARLDECIITAPFAGTITKVFVRQGDTAAVKTPLLEMADLDSLVIRCEVPEASTSEVRQGMNARVSLDALPGKELSAEIIRVFPELDPRMRTRTIELSAQDDVELAPGMFGRVRLILERIPDAVTVPVEAVVLTPSGIRVVFVAADGKAKQRKVEAGVEAGGRVRILSGLQPGEKVIVAGQERLKDGAEIRLPTPAGEGQPKGKRDRPAGAGQ